MYGEVASADYWVERLRKPIDLAGTVQRVVASTGVDLCLQMGIGNSLSVQSSAGLTLLPGLTDREPEWDTIIDNLAHMYTAGAAVNWSRFESGSGRRISLPTYPFERKRYWFEDQIQIVDDHNLSVRGEVVHPLLGVRLDLGGKEVVFETDLQDLSYLSDHRIGSAKVFPAAGFMELAVAAGSQVARARLDMTDLLIQRPISWGQEEACRVQVVLTPVPSGYDCRIMRRESDQWRTSAECRLTTATQDEPLRMMNWGADVDGSKTDIANHYQRCLEAGINYGPMFRGVRSLVAGEQESWGEISSPDRLHSAGYLLHPSMLDSCFQVTAASLGEHFTKAWLPVQVAHYSLFRSPLPGASLHTHVQIAPSDDDESISATLQIANREGLLIASINGLLLKPTRRTATFMEPASPKRRVADELLNYSPNPKACLQEYLYSRLSQIMEMATEEIPVDKPQNSLGLDSLMAFELRNELERDLTVTVPFEVFLQDLSLQDFSEMLLDKLQATHASIDGSVVPGEIAPSASWIEGTI